MTTTERVTEDLEFLRTLLPELTSAANEISEQGARIQPGMTDPAQRQFIRDVVAMSDRLREIVELQSAVLEKSIDDLAWPNTPELRNGD